MLETSTPARWEAFSAILSERVEKYFALRQTTRASDSKMVAKAVFGLSSFVATYAVLALASLPPFAFFLMYLLHGLTHLFVLMNIGHDANHGSWSTRPSVNRVLSYLLDLCGINSYMWRIQHHRMHHYCMNVRGRDEAVDGRGVLRFTPHAPHRPFHRFQHLYALPVYCLATLDWIFAKDFDIFFRLNIAGTRIARPPIREYVILIFSRIFYFGYMIVAPIILFGYSAWLVIIAFVVAQILIGFLILVVFQVTHLVEENAFPAKAEGIKNFVQHVFATTADYGAESRLLNFFTGGLNTHVIHHLHPEICHTHYFALSKIIRRTAVECGIPHREIRSTAEAMSLHLKLLRRLGREPLGVGQ